jgi:hypothetical protein
MRLTLKPVTAPVAEDRCTSQGHISFFDAMQQGEIRTYAELQEQKIWLSLGSFGREYGGRDRRTLSHALESTNFAFRSVLEGNHEGFPQRDKIDRFQLH